MWERFSTIWDAAWPIAVSIFGERSFWGETLKLLIQLGGAYFIAKLTVGWALGRFRTEKAWEREVAVMVDLVRNLKELRRLAASQRDQLASPSVFSDTSANDALERILQLHEERESLSAAVRLMMPRDVSPLVERLDSRLRKADSYRQEGDDLSYWTEQAAALDDAIGALPKVWAQRHRSR